MLDNHDSPSGSGDAPKTTKHPKLSKSKGGQSDDKTLRKSRAPVACRNCRLRKVRCDVSYSSGFCTNCRLNNVRCESAQGQEAKERQMLPTGLHDMSIAPVD